jgi:2-hydroxychromene-2-carboxylate isomerase
VNLVDELHAVTAALESDGISYAVCGGVAVTIHGATRTTKDIDLLVRREDVPRILEILRGLGYLFAALPMTFDAGTARERHVQRVTKIEGDHHLVVDLMLDEAALAGFLADQIDVELPEGRLRVVSRAGLLAMKRMAARPQDDADVERLEAGDGD